MKSENKSKTELEILKVLNKEWYIDKNITPNSLLISRSLDAMMHGYYHFTNHNIYKLNAHCIHSEARVLIFNTEYNDARFKQRRIYLRCYKKGRYL